LSAEPNWFRIDLPWWPEVVAFLEGQVWPRAAALIDLRWWQDQVLMGLAARIPTHRDLAARWGWGQKKARLLLAREPDWTDPHKADAWRAQPGHSRGTGRAQPKKEQPEQSPGEGTAGAQPGPKKGDARLPSHSTDTDTGLAAGAAASPAAVAPAAEVVATDWSLLASIQEKVVPGRGLTARDKRHAQQALDKGHSLETLGRVLVWAAQSQHQDAIVARKNGWGHLSGLLKPENAERRIAAALAWWAQTYGAPPPAPVAASTPPRPVVEEVTRLREEVADEGRQDSAEYLRLQRLELERRRQQREQDELARLEEARQKKLAAEKAAAEDRARSVALRRQRYAAMGLDAMMRSAGLGIGKAAPEGECPYSK
jgi:hypothetical protein